VSLSDLAEVSVKILNEREAHYLAQYPLCSTMPISDAKVAKEIASQIGREVDVASPSFEDGAQNVLNYLFGRKHDGATAAEGDPSPEITRDEAERLIMFYNRRGLNGSPNVMRWLLGREPTTIAAYVRKELQQVTSTKV
jgi:hypothetical protein